jgi:type II secretory pathway pseudopilin PulG
MSILRKPAYTIIELLVAILISAILLAATVSTYGLFRRSINADQARASLSQNGRVAMDRITRELRLTPEILTTLPTSPSDTSVPEPNSIEFEDGYVASTDPSYLTYHRYYLNGTTLEEDIKQYYFASAPSVRVDAKSVDSSGNAPISSVISTQAIAQEVALFALYGSKPLQVYITTTDLPSGQSYPLRTDVTPRNL